MIDQEEKDAFAFDNAVSPKRPLKIEETIGYSPSKKQKQSLPLLSGSNITMNSPDPLSKHHSCNEIQIKLKRKPNNADLILSSRSESTSTSIDKSSIGVSPTTLFYILDFDHDKENIKANVRNNKFIRRPIKNHAENKKNVGNNYKYRDDCSSISTLGCLVLGSTTSSCDSKGDVHLANSYATRGQIYEPHAGVAVVDTEESCYSSIEVSYCKSKDVSPSSVAEMPYDDYTCIDSYPTNVVKLPLPLHSFSSPTIFTVSNAPTTTPPDKTEMSDFRQHRIVPVVNAISDQISSEVIPIYSCVKDGTKPTPPPSASGNRGSSKTPATSSSTTTSNTMNVTNTTRSQISSSSSSSSSISSSSALGISSSISRNFNISPLMGNHNLNPIVLTKASRESLNSLTNINNSKKKEDRHSTSTNDEKEEEDSNTNGGRTIFEFKDNNNNNNNESLPIQDSPDSSSTIGMKQQSQPSPLLSLPSTLSPNSLPLPFFHPTNIISADLAPNSYLKRIHSNKMNRNGRSIKYQSTKSSNNNNNTKLHKNISESTNDSSLEFIHKNNNEIAEADDSEFDVLSLTHEFNLLTVDHSTNNSNSSSNSMGNSYENASPSPTTTVTSSSSSSSSSNISNKFHITPNEGLEVTTTTSTLPFADTSIVASTDIVGDLLETDYEENDSSSSPSDTNNSNNDDSDSTFNIDTAVATDNNGGLTYGNSTPEKSMGSRPKTHHSRMKRIKKRLIQNTEESSSKVTPTAISLEGSSNSNNSHGRNTTTTTTIYDLSMDIATNNNNNMPSEGNIEKDNAFEEGFLTIDTTTTSSATMTKECEKVYPYPINDSTTTTTTTSPLVAPSTPPGKSLMCTKEAVVALRRKQANHGHTRRKKIKVKSKMRRTYYYPKLECLVEGVVMSHGFPTWLLDVSVVSNNPLNDEEKGSSSSGNVAEDINTSNSDSTDTAMNSRGGQAVVPSTSPPPATSLSLALATTTDAQFSTTTTFNIPATATATNINSNSSSSYTTGKLSLTGRPGKRQLAPLHSQRGGLLGHPPTPSSSLHPTSLLSVLSLSTSSSAAAAPPGTTGPSSTYAMTTTIRNNSNNNDNYSHSDSISIDKEKDPTLSLWYRDQCNDLWKGDTTTTSGHLSNLPNDHQNIESELFRAIITRNINRMISLLNNCDHYFTIINLTEEFHGNSFLIIATQQDWKKGVRLLIKRGANINFQNKYGNTALHFACQFGFKEIEKYLRKKGALSHLRNCKSIDCSF